MEELHIDRVFKEIEKQLGDIKDKGIFAGDIDAVKGIPKQSLRERSKKRTVKPLLAIPSPRDIPDFLDSMGRITTPRVWAKYYKEPKAYELLRWFFLNQTTNDDYTHLVILPDDLITRQETINLLIQDLEESNIDYPVLCGVCNTYYWSYTLACCERLTGHFLSNEELDYIRVSRGNSPIIQVRREGFAMPFIRRDVVERIRFDHMLTTALDYMFSLNCYKRKIPIHIDTRARMLHLAEQPPEGNRQYFKVDKEKPYLLFQE